VERGHASGGRRGVLAALLAVLLFTPSAAARNPTPPGPEFDGEPAEYASAFAAKELCSRVLIAGRPPEPILTDLRQASALAPGFAIDTARITIDRRRNTVTVAHPGQPPRSATRAKSQGCSILPAYSNRLHFKPRRFGWRGPPAQRRWPLGERVWHGRSDIDRPALDAALDAYVNRPGTRGLVVVHRGELVGERYAPGFGPRVPQRSWSVAKSLTATLAGLLVDRRLLRLDKRPPIPAWGRDARRAITVRQLLNMSSGLKQNQFEGSARSAETFTPESEHAFIYFDGFDTYLDAIEARLEVPPGTRWQYRNANVLSLAHAMRRVVRKAGGDPQSFPQRRMLEPLGMRSTTLETDPYGHFIASGTAFTTPRDLARVGMLHLQAGRFGGRRLLSKRWVNFVRSPAPTEPGYGGFWWRNHESSTFTSLPPSVYFASGAFGQNILVIPSHRLVIARMGWNVPDDNEGMNAFARSVLLAVEAGEAG
jgi:CubicO group peptidase (beta-lactamase class C family)